MPREKKPTLKQRSDGRYKCKYHGVQFYGATPEEAYARLEEYKRQERDGITRKATVTDYALPWLKRTYPTVSDSTYTGLAIHLQHLIDEIGSKQIASVVPSDIKGVYSTQYKNRSNSYLKAARQLYSALFDSAVADGLVRSNPARDKTAKPHTGSKPKTRPITPQEREWIHTYCTDHRAYPVVMMMLYAGLRPQEAKAIKIDRDVDFEHDVITIHETAHNNGQKYAFTPQGKTEWANRRIPLFPPLKSALKGKQGYLVTSAHGERVTHTTWRVLWNSYLTQMETAINGIDRRWYGRRKDHLALKEAGNLPEWIPFDVHPYQLRHSFCCWLRDAGVEMNTARKWMGHADSKMILQVYDSVSEDRSEQERKKVENRVFGVQNGVQTENEKPATVEITGSENT